MLTTLKNERGYVYAICEWWICNVNGIIQDNGQYCQVREMWIHPDHRPTSFNPDNSTFWELILEMDKDPLMQSAEWVYWYKRKFDRQSKLYSRKEIVKRGEKNGIKNGS